MSKFIKLTTKFCNAFYADPKSIQSVHRPNNENCTDVRFGNGACIWVLESPEEVLKLIGSSEKE